MDASLEKLKGVQAADSKWLLMRLHDHAQSVRETGSGRLPKIRLVTAQGVAYDGSVLGVEDRSAGTSVLIQQEAYQGSNSGVVLSFVELYGPCSITINNAENFLPIVRFGVTPRWSKDENLTALNLKRHNEQIKEKLKPMEIDLTVAENLIRDGVVNNIVRDVVTGLQEYIEKTRKDEAGSQALREIRKIAVQLKEKYMLHCAREGSTLNVWLDPAEGLPSKEKFFSALDSEL